MSATRKPGPMDVPCEFCAEQGDQVVATDEWCGSPVCTQCYLQMVVLHLEDLIEVQEGVDWSAVPDVSIAEAAMWTKRVISAKEELSEEVF